ncbi:EIF2D family protein [Megaselia abdita]
MFIKPFKIKNNAQLKGSDTKRLKARIQNEYPNLTDSEYQMLFPSKSSITSVKVITHSGFVSSAFAVDKRPMFFEIEGGKLAPTLYTLWLLPRILPYFTTVTGVLQKLSNGADLMLPGVIPVGTGLRMYGNFKKGQLVAINLTFNKAAVGVGLLSRSSDDLYMAGGHGPAVKPVHLFGDKLWSLEPSVTLQIPTDTTVAAANIASKDDFPALGEEPKKKTNVEETVSETLPVIDNLQIEESVPQEEPKDSLDDILKNAFLSACKYKGKDLALPILTSSFYRTYVLEEAKCAIEIKQTKYKKVSTFLKEMADQGFIVVREETKGVDKIYSIDFEHSEIVDFIPDQALINDDTKEKETLFHSSMAELYLVTDDTLPFFTKFDYKRNEGMAIGNVRKLLREYCQKNQLPFTDQSRTLTVLDDCLRNICDGKESASLDEINSIFLRKMKHTYEMVGVNELKQSNKPAIQITVAKRSGNKNVTLVKNLESYGIILTEFIKMCKHGAAASTTIVKVPSEKHELLQVQGNQVKFIHDLLTEKYKISPKHINGLQFAKKTKK